MFAAWATHGSGRERTGQWARADDDGSGGESDVDGRTLALSGDYVWQQRCRQIRTPVCGWDRDRLEEAALAMKIVHGMGN